MLRRSVLIGVVGLVALAGALVLPAQDSAEVADTKAALVRAQLAVKEVALVRAAERTFLEQQQQYEVGLGDINDLFVWSRRWMDAALSAADANAERIAAIRAHLARVTRLKANIEALRKAGIESQATESAAEFYRIEAELLLARADG